MGFVRTPCSISEMCVSQCGEKCMDECNMLTPAYDGEAVTKARECRLEFIRGGGAFVL